MKLCQKGYNGADLAKACGLSVSSVSNVMTGARRGTSRRADLIHELRDGERASKEHRDNKISERQDRESERERQSFERQRAIKEAEQRAEREHAESKTSNSRRGNSR